METGMTFKRNFDSMKEIIIEIEGLRDSIDDHITTTDIHQALNDLVQKLRDDEKIQMG